MLVPLPGSQSRFFPLSLLTAILRPVFSFGRFPLMAWSLSGLSLILFEITFKLNFLPRAFFLRRVVTS